MDPEQKRMVLVLDNPVNPSMDIHGRPSIFVARIANRVRCHWCLLWVAFCCIFWMLRLNVFDQICPSTILPLDQLLTTFALPLDRFFCFREIAASNCGVFRTHHSSNWKWRDWSYLTYHIRKHQADTLTHLFLWSFSFLNFLYASIHSKPRKNVMPRILISIQIFVSNFIRNEYIINL